MVNVKKKNGSMQEFSSNKLKNSIMKAGASAEVAERIANEIAAKIHEGTTTAEIKSLVASSLASMNAAWSDSYMNYAKATN